MCVCLYGNDVHVLVHSEGLGHPDVHVLVHSEGLGHVCLFIWERCSCSGSFRGTWSCMSVYMGTMFMSWFIQRDLVMCVCLYGNDVHVLVHSEGLGHVCLFIWERCSCPGSFRGTWSCVSVYMGTMFMFWFIQRDLVMCVCLYGNDVHVLVHSEGLGRVCLFIWERCSCSGSFRGTWSCVSVYMGTMFMFWFIQRDLVVCVCLYGNDVHVLVHSEGLGHVCLFIWERCSCSGSFRGTWSCVSVYMGTMFMFWFIQRDLVMCVCLYGNDVHVLVHSEGLGHVCLFIWERCSCPGSFRGTWSCVSVYMGTMFMSWFIQRDLVMCVCLYGNDVHVLVHSEGLGHVCLFIWERCSCSGSFRGTWSCVSVYMGTMFMPSCHREFGRIAPEIGIHVGRI